MTAQERAEAVVTTIHRPLNGGLFFVKLGGVDPPVLLGPYANPALAKEDAAHIQKFLVAALEQTGEPLAKAE